MIKILHFIKLGDCNLNDQEIYNLESWKRCYPDFEIRYGFRFLNLAVR